MSRNQQAPKKSYAPLIIILAVLVAAVAAGLWLMRRGDGPAAADGATTASSAARPAATTPAQPSSAFASAPPGAQPPRARGPESAPVTLEEFGDYQCPPCGRIHPVLHKIERDYGDRVRVVFRHLPLQSMHKNAVAAARSAEAAGLQGRFWEMHDKLYENQGEWSDSPDPRPFFADYAKKIGMDVEKFKADVDKPMTGARVYADAQRANALRVAGTPTIFLNGRLLTADQTLNEGSLRAEIEAALAGKGK